MGLQGSCPFVKIKFKDFQGPHEGYISESARIEAPKTPRSGVLGEWVSQKPSTRAMHCVLENLIQARSRTFRHRFKDFQGPCLFSRTFQALNIWKKIQGFSRIRKSPGIIRCGEQQTYLMILISGRHGWISGFAKSVKGAEADLKTLSLTSVLSTVLWINQTLQDYLISSPKTV